MNIIALILLVLAIARPRAGQEEVVEVNSGIAIEILVDRLVVDRDMYERITESVELALTKGEGLLRLFLPDSGVEELFSEKLACPEHGTFLEELEPRIFSFNSPYGACNPCSGLGHLKQFDAELIIPDSSLSISQGAIAPWAGGRNDDNRVYYWDRLRALSEQYEFDLSTPWRCLLYTSPSPRDGLLSRMPSSA